MFRALRSGSAVLNQYPVQFQVAFILTVFSWAIESIRGRPPDLVLDIYSRPDKGRCEVNFSG
jgi:hypothetical protein